MIKYLFKPFFKRFLGLFISMVFVSSLSIMLLTSFASGITNLKRSFKDYVKDNQDIAAITKISVTKRKDIGDITNVEGVDKVEYRVVLDAFMKKDSGKNTTVRLMTFKDDADTILKRYIVDQVELNDEMPNISLTNKFARNNNIKCGDVVKLGYFKTFIEFYVNEIIETPEAIQPRINEYVWNDSTDFGYVYVNETEINKGLHRLAVKLEEKVESDPTFKNYYEKAVNEVGVTFPDLVDIIAYTSNFTNIYTNQILIKAEDGYNSNVVLSNVTEYLNEQEVEVKDAKVAQEMFYILFMENAIRMLRVVTIFLPVFFYSITMIIIGLFMNQIIKAMTPQMGIMMSIGVEKKQIISLFLLFTFIMSTASSILGNIGGIFVSRTLVDRMISVYSIPTISRMINPWVAVAGSFALLLFAELATIISCQAIFKITPKDATISNEAKRKRIPPKVEAFIEKAPMNLKLGINSIFQNTKRFVVSTFSIFASFAIILLSLFFWVSKDEIIDQTINRRLTFEAQVYLSEVLTDEEVTELKSQNSIKAIEDCYYTYVEASSNNSKEKTYLECLAFDETSTTNLISIPDKKGTKSTSIKDTGIVIPKYAADKLKVKKGDKIIINDIEVEVIDVSNQYFHPVTFLSKEQLSEITTNYVSSLIVDLNNQENFLEYMSNNHISSITVFTESLSKDIHNNLDSVNIFIVLLIGFSLFMGLIILTIMAQNALMDQQRQLSVLRLIGFRVVDVSNLWTFESILQLIFSSILAIPLGMLFAYILFNIASSQVMTFPFTPNIVMVAFAFLFIFLIVVISHLSSMYKISRWNLADNTRSRE